ncbi:MAG: D-serine ammonia-lyase [Spirochaetales bacterium]|nr:D-serine ammonia-lyase [Spirochaetales bacterium]
MKTIGGMSLEQWFSRTPELRLIAEGREVFWSNPDANQFKKIQDTHPFGLAEVQDAEVRLRRFAPYIRKMFPETEEAAGIIESAIRGVPELKALLNDSGLGEAVTGGLLFKLDNELPIAGSVKARGGIYEVLKHAESLAIREGLLSLEDDYSVLTEKRFTDFYSGYSLAVGSTGNLGLSIGIVGAALGFKSLVHMSSDAKFWKKELLRMRGVSVVEYESDYSHAVAEGRKQAGKMANSHFVDDENSQSLFLGYAVAALRLKKQLGELAIPVDSDHPLFVYLPCGVGGGPGGITFGLKLVFGDNVHCFFAEPVEAPCMLIGLATGLHEEVSVADFGLSGETLADGLAVGRPSGFIGRNFGSLISGVFTVTDELLLKFLKLCASERTTRDIKLEPSALAGLVGPWRLLSTEAGKSYLSRNKMEGNMDRAHHIIWATGGGMVPQEILEGYLRG